MRGLDFVTEDTLAYTFLSMILSKGGEYWVNNRFSLSSPQAVEALQTMVNMVVVDRVTNLDSATGAEGIADFEFLGNGQAMMVPRGPWAIAELEEEFELKLGVDFEYVPFPFYGPEKAFAAETGWGMCVPNSTKVSEAAWSFVRFFMERDNLMRHNLACAQVPARKSIVSNPNYVRQAPYMADLLEILPYGRFVGPFNTEVLKSNLTSVFISLCTNDVTYRDVAAALAALENRLNTELRL
jgi:multiple sugar transport system substrate-binding protein